MAKRVQDDLDWLSSLGPEEVDAVLREDFGAFVQAMFPHVVAGGELKWAPYLDLICAKLAEVCHDKGRRLVITLPPRHLKTFCVSVALPAFYLAHYPTREVMCVSYGMELAKTIAEDSRRLMQSAAYERLFGGVLARAKQSVRRLKTAQGGIRLALSLEGAATGRGADLLIFDDPQKPGEVLSEAIRAATNKAFEDTFLTRRNHSSECNMIVVMQRLHEDDFVSHVLEKDPGWEILNLPAIAEEDEAYTYRSFLGDHVFRRREGEALHPSRVPLEELERTRASMGEAAFAAQYQQRPAPVGGGLVKAVWLRRYTDQDRPSGFDRIVQSWDTANNINEWNDYSVCTTWGVKGKNYYLLHVFRKRLEYPDLRRAALEQARMHHATIVLIEDRASGTQLLQDLRRDGFGNVRAIKPERDKQTRMANQTGLMETGRVFIPAEASWLPDYLHELTVFPSGRYDDQVDSTSQALQWLDGCVEYEGLREFYRQEAARARGEGEEIWVIKGAPGVGLLIDIEGGEHRPGPDGCFRLRQRHAVNALRQYGWSRVR
jgi:predicted phage terminase large subunit-like protein